MAAAAPPSPTPVPQNADAIWLANNGALELARNIGYGKAQFAEEGAEGNYRYGAGQLQRQEPLKLTASRNQANTQGLAESGVLAQRQGNIQTDYAAKQARLGEIRKRAVEAAAMERNTANQVYEKGEGVQLAELENRSPKQLIANPPGEPFNPAAEGRRPASPAERGTGAPGQPIQAGFRRAEYGVGQGTDKPMPPVPRIPGPRPGGAGNVRIGPLKPQRRR